MNVPFNRFFIAWSRNHSSSPIQTQTFSLDTRQNRQYGGLWPDQSLLSFASANPGRLYINGDEPDQYCIDPHEYAGIYRNFVTAVRGADPTARVSPAGFAEPNDRCCRPGDEPCRQSRHSIGYAEQFYNAYVQRYGVAPPVDEWRFHDFGLASPVGDLDGWWARIDKEAAWSVSHGANMVLGAWGLLGWNEPEPAHQEHLKQAIGRLINDPRINEAVYWAYESWAGEHHYLTNEDGSLTPEGQTYANPLTDIPTGVAIADAANGHAKLQWSNTTSAWPAEAEFWVQAPGSNSFVHKASERVAGPGAAQTPLTVFNIGDNVKGRVRYYNVYGQAAWSSFSDAVLMESDQVAVNKKPSSRKGPLLCFLSRRIQSQPCN
ncbi:MAG: hypothetical protein ABI681_06665 [Gemmatimonadales bacterium]